MESKDIRRLLGLIREKSFQYGEFTLASGMTSAYYFDGRLTTLWPEGAYLVGREVIGLLRNTMVAAIGGPTVGADPIVTAVALLSHLEGNPIPAFIVRKEPKKHGMQRSVEGHLPAGSTVALVDDVITTGGSLFKAIEVVEAEKCQVRKIVVLLDRNEGGADELRRRGYDFTALFIADHRGNIEVASG